MMVHFEYTSVTETTVVAAVWLDDDAATALPGAAVGVLFLLQSQSFCVPHVCPIFGTRDVSWRSRESLVKAAHKHHKEERTKEPAHTANHSSTYMLRVTVPIVQLRTVVSPQCSGPHIEKHIDRVGRTDDEEQDYHRQVDHGVIETETKALLCGGFGPGREDIGVGGLGGVCVA